MSEKSELVQKRGRVKGTLTRLKTFAENINENTSIEDISIRLKKLEEAWAEFQSIEDSLLHMDTQAQSEMEEYEEKYFIIQVLLTREMNSRSLSGPTINNSISDRQQSFFQSFDHNNSQRNNSIRLPKLNIPTFAGDYREWIAFQDLFEASIHLNPSLTGSQKLQYLKGLLKGPAANVIRHLTISDSNYIEAWEKLKTRFNKRAHITTSLIKTFLDSSTLNQPTMKSLRNLYDTFDEVLRGLKALGSEAEKRDPWLIYLALIKIDSETRELWLQEVTDKEFPSFQDFLKFLSKRCDALEASGAMSKRSPPSFRSLHTIPMEREVICPRCNGSHPLYKCENFKADSSECRRSFVAEKSLCFRCLGTGHSVRSCRSKMKCHQCKGTHHPLLHSTQNNQRTMQHIHQPNASSLITSFSEHTTTERASAIPSTTDRNLQPNNRQSNQGSAEVRSFNTYIKYHSTQNESCERTRDQHQVCLLPTVVANIPDQQGRMQPCRILLDSGSQLSLISESCVQRLNLKRENARLSITGLQAAKVGTTRGKTLLNLVSRRNDYSLPITVFIMNQLTSLVPSRTFAISHWTKLKSLYLADPEFHKAFPIDVIIGADYFFEILRNGKIHDSIGKVIAQETAFGWVVFGNISSLNSPCISLHASITDLDKSLRRFWESEELPITKSPLTEDEHSCESHFKENVTNTEDGRYVVSLPFKSGTGPLGDSRESAVKRLHAMERRFRKDHVFKEQYRKFMQEYLDLAHMECVPREEQQPRPEDCFYLPHHAVFKNEPNPKIRVVFDGSCRSSSGISLNEKLLVGPVVQRDLISILMNFRKYPIAFSADLQKMYRQVLVKPEDRNFQRIVWREDPSEQLRHYRLTTVTYGTSCAPFLATRVLQQIAHENKQQFPEASAIIEDNFYVDDLLSGSESVTKAVKLKLELCQIFKANGFELTKWCSNSPELLRDNANLDKVISIDDKDNTVRVLGMQWNPAEDIFSFSISAFESGGVSKRIILSESSRIFDPLGWLSPVTVSIKILLQHLWVLKCDWDDQLPEEVTKKWESFKQQLGELTKVKIPRRVYISPTDIQLHGFSDASEAAYGAVVYCRSRHPNGQIITRLVSSKTRVAPLQQVSIPRLELCGALLLARLLEKIVYALQLNNVKIFAWTDSKVVLAWLSDRPRRWKTYIANRTAEIRRLIPHAQWRYVPSKSNPADLASRGIATQQLPTLQLWWNGPTWLSAPSNDWPVDPKNCVDKIAYEEERRAKILTCSTDVKEEDAFAVLVNRVGSFSKLNRILAYCRRFIGNTKIPTAHRKTQMLSTSELHEATKICIRCVQQIVFPSEISEIKNQKSVSPKSPIANLNPFLDEFGILRVGGRLEQSTCSFSAKHPIILQKSHPVSEMLVRDLHKTHLHPGPSLLVGIIRQRYWIVGARDLAKKISNRCITCFKQRATKTTQLMGNLPAARVTPSRPFSTVGIDYAGPVMLSTKSGRGAKSFKGYIALFICLSTRALHLELVTSLSAEAFIATLRRFISRRGVPARIYSDNGTNFVGAKRFISELQSFAASPIADEKMSHFLAQNNITWSFIPPSAPHFGGIWEAGVKSVKWHIRRVVGETMLTFEEMITLLTQIEALLNSRPYSNLSPTTDDLDTLTPGHFLIGQPLTTLPDPDYTEVKTTRLGRWQQLQAMVQGFWKRWRLEYLSSLQERPKWRQEQNSLQRGELVIIHEDRLPPSKWLTGRVIETHPGEDGLVRVVSLRTKQGTLKRSINKVYKLPIS